MVVAPGGQEQIAKEKEAVEKALNGAKDTTRNCLKCTKASVCIILKTMVKFMEEWPDQSRPFHAGEIAQICKAYTTPLLSP